MTSEERYQFFCNRFESDPSYVKSFFEEYPVLIRLIMTKIVNSIKFLEEFLFHFHCDKDSLEKTFNNGEKICKISHLHLSKGDAHKSGKSVSTLELNNGIKVVYKPRPLDIDIQFQDFIEWINNNYNSQNTLKTTCILSRETYGWSEFIEFRECSSNTDIHKFYERLGRILAILHIMNATDFHYENLIAHGEHPVLIDYESLFHHTIIPEIGTNIDSVFEKAEKIIGNSVVSTGMIPTESTQGVHNQNSLDVSGIKGQSQQILPFEIPTITNQFTDEIRIQKQKGILDSGINSPKLSNTEINIIDYLTDLKNGFRDMYLWFIDNRNELIENIMRFTDKEIRKIFRNTMGYTKLLDMSYHPDFMRNQIDREILLFRLWEPKIQNRNIKKLVKYEINDLLNGDVPYFTTSPNDKKLCSSSREELQNFYYKCGLELSIEKIKSLSEEECIKQLSIIETTIATAYSQVDLNIRNANKKYNTYTVKSSEKSLNLLQRAESIADVLLENAVREGHGKNTEMCWTSMILKGLSETNWSFSVTGTGLYDGNPGIATFFCYLWKLTQKDKYREAAYATINPVKKLLPELVNNKNISIGAFTGLTGILYSMHHLSVVFNDKNLTDEVLYYTKHYKTFISNDRIYDVMGGSAGALFFLLNLYKEHKYQWILDISESLVQHLMNSSISQSKGLAWPPPYNQENPYIGFSHGNAGIAASLSQYYKINPSKELKDFIEQSLIYENSFYNDDEMNWYSVQTDRYPIAWCHGAPGILLGRKLIAINNLDFDFLDDNLKKSLSTTMKASIGSNYSLCHGELGVADILLKVHELDNEFITEEQLNVVIQKIIQKILSNYEEINVDIHSVALMNGLTSIGYGLLRLCNPYEVPSVLTLDSPIR
ncbi:type 2 lanthipeptide synthetase LanM family protein [Bacillus sp. AC79A.1]